MLKIEDVKVGDELVCINNNNEYMVVDNIPASECFLTEKGAIPYENLKYFKKKEQSQQYTLDDLICAANKAQRDGLSFGLTLVYSDKNGDRYTDFKATQQKIKQEIEYIQSLYKEIFVIESHEDIRRIKNNANITLSNRNRIEQAVHENRGDYIVFNDSSDDVYTFNFMVLKGATVEQERGRDDRP